jgi:hypothetical protein
METTFGKLREEMLGYSLRPSSQTFAHMYVCGEVHLRSPVCAFVCHELSATRDQTDLRISLYNRCEAYIVLGDADLALGALESLQAANGTTKLLKRKFLTELICELGLFDGMGVWES